MDHKNIALIVAGGNGVRMGSQIPKQYISINGLPIIYHTIKRLHDHSQINKVVVVISAEHEDLFKKSIQGLNVEYCIGGETRSQSVRNGLEYISKYNPEYVLIHDAVRPNFSKKLVTKLLEIVYEHQAVIPVLPMSSTIKEINNNKIKNTIDRSNLCEAQTPQVFAYNLIINAYHNLLDMQFATDDAFVVENYGSQVYIIPGEKNNIKITTQEDLTFQEFLFRREKDTCFA